MKLTTVNQKIQNHIHFTKAFKLKKMIQQAAKSSIEHKLTYKANLSQTVPSQQINLKMNKEKINRLYSESAQNKQNVRNKQNISTNKLKILSLTKSQKNLKISECKSSRNLKKMKYIKRVGSQPLILKQNQGMNIDRFHMGRKLGRGRFGNVYMAEQKNSGFILAIKIINKKQVKEAQMEDQVISQIKVQSFLSHPNILSMYGFFDDEINIYLALELADQCLFKVLRRNISFCEEKTGYYAKQVIQGLKYLHSENIMHRDLKPENIMMVNNVVKLADFGWSIYSPIYKRQTFCGTLDYVSPQIIKGDYYDEGVDIWSLGVLLYELTVGMAPFEGAQTEEQTFSKIVRGKFQLPNFLSSSLNYLISKTLQGQANKRWSLKQVLECDWIRNLEVNKIMAEIWEWWSLRQ